MLSTLIRVMHISSLLFIILILCTESLSYTFNVDEFKSVAYDVDILNNPILSGETSSEFIIHLASKYGQEYQCSLPDMYFEETKVLKVDHNEEIKSPDISALLKPLANQPCLTKTKDWWTYKFCYGKIIKQYHTEDNKSVAPTIILGIYDSEFDWKSDFKDGAGNLNRERRYHSQYYVNGTKCDVTGAMRTTEVRFVCEEGAADFISHVDEPESCQYVIVVNTNRVCPHPHLQPPPMGKPKSITCNPVLSSENYDLYQKEQQDEKIKVEEIRKKWLAKQEKRLSQMKREQNTEKVSDLIKDNLVVNLAETSKEKKVDEDKKEKNDNEDETLNFNNYDEEDKKFLAQLNEMELSMVKLSDLMENDKDDEQTTDEIIRIYRLILMSVIDINNYMGNVFRPRLDEITKFMSRKKDATQEIEKTIESLNNKHNQGENLEKIHDELQDLKTEFLGLRDKTLKETKFYNQLLKKSEMINNRYLEVSRKLTNFHLKFINQAEKEELFASENHFDNILSSLKKTIDIAERVEIDKTEEKEQDGVSTLKPELEMESSEEIKSSEKKNIDEETDKLIAAAAKSAINAFENTLGVKIMVDSIEDEVENEDVENYRYIDSSKIQSAINRLLAGDDETMQHLQHLSNLERNYKFVWKTEKIRNSEKKKDK